MRFRLKRLALAIFAAAFVLTGCAHTAAPPPRELVAAREAYARANAGPARQVSPARVELARRALVEAERAYDAGAGDEARDLAYVALRRAQAAEAEAEAALAMQRREQALRELAAREGVEAERARNELAAAERAAAEERQRAAAAQERAAAEQSRATEAQQRLEAERQAQEAERARTERALTELAQVADVEREPRGLVVRLAGKGLFAPGEAALAPGAEAKLDTVAEALRSISTGAGYILIEGHSDATGPRAYNRELSEQRAEAVRNYLAARGIPQERLVVEGVGEDDPIATNRTREGRAANRRVEIVIPPPVPASTPAMPPAPQPRP